MALAALPGTSEVKAFDKVRVDGFSRPGRDNLLVPSGQIILEDHERHKPPGMEFGRLGRLAEVLTGQALLDVSGDADIATIGMIDALEGVDELPEDTILTV